MRWVAAFCAAVLVYTATTAALSVRESFERISVELTDADVERQKLGREIDWLWANSNVGVYHWNSVSRKEFREEFMITFDSECPDGFLKTRCLK